MARYKVIVTKTVKKQIFVDADSCETAMKLARQKIVNGDICLAEKGVLSFAAEYDDGKGNELVVSRYCIGSSVDLMDQFDERNSDNTYKYKRLVIKYYTLVDCIDSKNVWVNLLIDRISYGDKKFGDITFTELKRDSCDGLREYIKTAMQANGHLTKVGEQIMFEVPYYLRAQRSVDRMPGGWEYGTLYGETSAYGIVGIRLEK